MGEPPSPPSSSSSSSTSSSSVGRAGGELGRVEVEERGEEDPRSSSVSISSVGVESRALAAAFLIPAKLRRIFIPLVLALSAIRTIPYGYLGNGGQGRGREGEEEAEGTAGRKREKSRGVLWRAGFL